MTRPGQVSWRVQPYGGSWFAFELAADGSIAGPVFGPMASRAEAEERVAWIDEERAALRADGAVAA